MLYETRLHHQIQHCLDQVVQIQLSLLHYAAGRDTIDNSTCADHLNAIPETAGRGGDISGWFWGSGKELNRVRWLREFAEGESSQAKQDFVESLEQDVGLFSSGTGCLQPQFLLPRSPRTWKYAVRDLLIFFYEQFRDKEGLPSCLFADGSSFDAQEFLTLFKQENNHLGVCAICDESDYCTVDNRGIHAEIDHFLPKARYPHLSCHPCNLLPICHHCNASIKRDRDPLDGSRNGRRCLENIPLPYRSPPLAPETYLRILSGSTSHKHVRFTKIKSRGTQGIEDQIDVFEQLYRVPERWNGKVDQIGEILFRRMQQFIGHISDAVPGDDVVSVMRSRLDQLLYFMHEQDASKDPYAYVMTWWLAKLINEEVEPFLTKDQWSALLEELANWMKLHSNDCARRLQLAKELKTLCK